ncbi:AcrR family transcriptional regulator [Mumia flava]|uniref:AcrR family transcriptional regulator n=1 Tax=Mumia flava TaxID=1348852 RepID=A0A0B2BEM4_9ACTN|nr:TetR/AcrR family transcriptional regulator [Mumia flava]PJJ57346.1 AcrR family transcriptional regulator [Mumia flava]
MTRRRGEELERALLDAAWAELAERGYAAFTVDGVAERAGTSKPVLYRRWADKQELTRAAVRHAIDQLPRHEPDTGSLRGDVLASLRYANETRVELVGLISAQLGAFFHETETRLVDLRSETRREDSPWGIGQPMFVRALERGEVDPERLTPRIAALPLDLFRNEVLSTLRPVPEPVLEEIVDTIFLPLVTPR